MVRKYRLNVPPIHTFIDMRYFAGLEIAFEQDIVALGGGRDWRP
jgi:hypothetical protein